MLLASVSAIRKSLGFEDMTDINEAIGASLKIATTTMAARLGVDNFDRATAEDTFYVNEPGYQNGSHVQTEFLLRHPFVSDVVVSRADTYVGLTGSPVADTGAMIIKNADKGVLFDGTTVYGGNYVRVSYAHGFEIADTDPDEPADFDFYKPEQVPEWLRQAAVCQAMITLSGHPEVKALNILSVPGAYEDQLRSILAPRQRYAPTALLPL